MTERVKVLVVGYRKFSELINALLPEFSDEADVVIVESVASDHRDYSDMVKRYAADVVVSTGSNAAYLKATLKVPVVSQRVSDTDVIEALGKARRVAPTMHLFSYSGEPEPSARLLESLPELLGVSVQAHSYTTTDEAAESLLLALAGEAPEVIVGPSYICRLAEQRGVPAILVYNRSSARLMLREAIDTARAAQSVARALTESPDTGPFVIRSPQMERVSALASTYARGRAAVLLQGESGTGKEHIAREIHRRSEFSSGRLVPVNCGSIPNELFESELFGYVEGAFTSSRRGGRVGLIERANGGVLFLDEVGEMPLQQQVKLLRALQERRIRPVGGNREIALDFKVIAATNRDLRDAVTRGEFRDDLYFRLNVFSLRIPALRDRPEDIPPIAGHYLREYARQYATDIDTGSLLAQVVDRLLGYAWPGNVRELQNFAERLVVNCLDHGAAAITPQTLRDILPELIAADSSLQSSGALKAQEQAAIDEAMQRFGGDRQRVAEYLGISTTTLWRRLNTMGRAGVSSIN
ncbi:sigma 54-interacting transcriptional regulator [Chromatocurvus halotolerans]|uniref:Propionate catabolism operon transcriptional regulator n=1 Tax=Chromatocurvus halotolerans TaxID=1132028 RepID=A0A4R2KQK9_9GAMM|nr:sigma 54-interacting transcriptional regulator [Chromatocurvus halotolerans]TCO75904.1 propionate catabolism operon transcriptional regulator [Chromatocurvus halotolerans]